MRSFGSRAMACLVLGAIGVFVGVMLARLTKSDADLAIAAEPPPRRIADGGAPAASAFQPPSADLSPDAVVRLQVEALGRLRDDPTAIRQCFVMASPSNRSVTGPIDRFAKMVQEAPYTPLVEGARRLVGRAEVRGDRATVLVTVMNKARAASSYRFFLSRQNGSGVEGCWMTDGVLPQATSNRTPPPAAPST